MVWANPELAGVAEGLWEARERVGKCWLARVYRDDALQDALHQPAHELVEWVNPLLLWLGAALQEAALPPHPGHGSTIEDQLHILARKRLAGGTPERELRREVALLGSVLAEELERGLENGRWITEAERQYARTCLWKALEAARRAIIESG